MTSLTVSRPVRRTRRRGLGLLLLAAAAAFGTGCGDRKDAGGGQVAARVNKDEITVQQVNAVLQQQRGLKPEQAEAAGRQILERLVDQQLALQKADEIKLDRDPRVQQQIDAARREIIARAYAEKVGEGAPKPTADEVRRYYEDKPALFAQRRIYNLQELSIEARPDQIEGLRSALTGARNIGEFVEHLKANDFRFSANQAVRAAEQLPLQNLDAIARLQDGQAMLVPSPTGAQVVVLAGSRAQPVSEEQARPAIEQFILNERRRKLVEDEIKSLRAAARIEFVGKFTATPAGPASAASR